MTVTKFRNYFKDIDLDIFTDDELIYLLMELEKLFLSNIHTPFIRYNDLPVLIKIYLKDGHKVRYARNIDFNSKLVLLANKLNIEVRNRRRII